VFCLSKEYNESELKEIKKHNNFGEIEMCLNEKLTYNIKVKSRYSELYVLKKNDFLKLSVNFKDFIEMFLQKSLSIYLRFTELKTKVVSQVEEMQQIQNEIRRLNTVKQTMLEKIEEKEENSINDDILIRASASFSSEYGKDSKEILEEDKESEESSSMRIIVKDECNINNNDKTSRNKTSTTFSKRIYNQYFTIIPSPMFIINTHHINSIYYNPTTILFELKKEIEYNLNNNNISSLQNKCSLFSNFDIHNNIITPLMLIPINKCNLITCKGPQNDNYILNFLYKSLPYETSLTNIHITKGISNKTKIINILFNRKNTSTNSNNIKHQKTKKHNLYHQLTLTTQERVNDSEKKLTNFKPTHLSTFYCNEHDRYRHKRVSQKLKESLFKTNKKMLRSTQTIKLYNKIINDPLSIDGSISRTQEMNTLTHNHRLNQLIFYIHTNQKVAFINYFEQNNCKEIINHADSSGNVLLIHAIKYNQKDLFYFILENGANVNIANNYGNTPLHFAFAYKNYNLVNELIKCKANEFAQNMKGATPWDCMGLTCD
jgi:hypothetical protein